MAFTNHYNIATMGIRAGHKLMSMMGFGFSVEVIVTPVESYGGGGTRLIPDLHDYNVTIRITRKGKVWEHTYKTTIQGLSSLESVVASFKRITRIFDQISITLSAPIINITKWIVNIRNKK